jgi:hypothetical protein
MKNILEALNDIVFILFRLICVPILFFIFYTLGLLNIIVSKTVNGVAQITEYFINEDK